MFLPNAQAAVVPMRKITDYLLSLENLNGRAKARFFLAFGFDKQNWQKLAEALKQHAVDNEVTSIVDRGAFGVNYVVEGRLRTPDGRDPDVRVIWTIDNGDDTPRLVSAYPM
ncbi:MAG: DUF6883 domain-containing protein [Aggregatilineales bacterium]